jgi:hypothetical protein
MTKNRRELSPPPVFALEKLLNRDYTLHAEREVRSAVIGILAGLDVPERNRNGIPRIHLQVARELTHLVGSHVRIELGSCISRNRRWVERDIVRASGHDYELDAISRLDREIRGLEAVAFRVADHLHFMGRSRYRGRGDRTRGRGSGRSGSGRRSRRSRRINRHVRSISRFLLSTCTSAKCNYTSSNSESVEPHLMRPPRAVR